MIKATINKKDGGVLLLLGLSYRNLDLLREQKPITIDTTPFGNVTEIVLFADETERKIVETFGKMGYIEAKAADTMLRAIEEDGRGKNG